MWSYSIYLLHAIVLGGISNVIEYIFKISPNEPQGLLSIAINITVLLITIVLSKYSYENIETRYRDKIKLKLKHFNQRKKASA
jgi:peptidoglycan/LPS O-acetylase OafA/YrhL